MRVLAALLFCLVPAVSHASFVSDCLTRCGIEYATCRDTCGAHGVPDPACRRAIIATCRHRGIVAACGSACATHREVRADAGPGFHLHVAVNPCAAIVDLTVRQDRGAKDVLCNFTIQQGRNLADGVRCRAGEHIPDLFANRFFCYQAPFTNCYAPGSDGQAVLLRDFPPWLDLTAAFDMSTGGYGLPIPPAP